MQAWVLAQAATSGGLQGLNSEQFFTFVSILAVAGTAAIAAVGYFLNAYLGRRAELNAGVRQAEIAADLKAGMIERGFSADDIERVLAARDPSSSAGRNV